MTVLERLKALRELMKERKIDAYLVPTDDFHASEYVGDYFKCRKYITGFTGSAGTAVIMQDMAGLWTDGRYFLQAADQLEGSTIQLFKMGEPEVPTVHQFLADKLEKGMCLGFDGRTVSAREAEELEEEPVVERRTQKKKAEKKQPEKKTTEKPSFYSRNTKNTKTTESSSKVTPMRTAKRNPAPAAMEVCVIKPNNMEETREIADTLIAGCTVVLNLEGIDVSVAQRVIDFSSGTCYAMGGSLQKVSDYIFILTPSSVGITGDYQEIIDGAFMSSIQTEY